jgi:hypothetical protein
MKRRTVTKRPCESIQGMIRVGAQVDASGTGCTDSAKTQDVYLELQLKESRSMELQEQFRRRHSGMPA